jgi:hypothetical protein
VGNSRKFVCPFCGSVGKGSDEHVWSQWLRETEGAKALLQNSHGERTAMPSDVIRKDADGRYRTVSEPRGSYAKLLPHVQVRVCEPCNTGWMSRLEDQVKQIVAPFVFDGDSHVTLSADDLLILATWATKSWMAYALTGPAQKNPFLVEEYREMAALPQPLDRSQIWLLHATEPHAHVGIGIASTLLRQGPPPDLEVPDNAAHAYLAAAGVVLFMALVPPDAPDEMVGIFAPSMLTGSGIRRVWPNPRKQYFPLDTVPDAQLAALLDFPSEWANHMGLPVDGLTDEDAATVFQDFLDGADPAELRSRRQAAPDQ